MSKYIYEDEQVYVTAETIRKFKDMIFSSYENQFVAYQFPEQLADKIPLKNIARNIITKYELNYDTALRKIQFLGKYLDTEISHCINVDVAEVVSEVHHQAFSLNSNYSHKTLETIDSHLSASALKQNLIAENIPIDGLGYLIDSDGDKYINVFDTMMFVTSSDQSDEYIAAPERIYLKNFVIPIDPGKIKRDLRIDFYPDNKNLPMIHAVNFVPSKTVSSPMFCTHPTIGVEEIFIDSIKERPEMKRVSDFNGFNDYCNYWNQHLRNRQFSHKKDYFNDLIL